jgi:hypothetical protein
MIRDNIYTLTFSIYILVLGTVGLGFRCAEHELEINTSISQSIC